MHASFLGAESFLPSGLAFASSSYTRELVQSVQSLDAMGFSIVLPWQVLKAQKDADVKHKTAEAVRCSIAVCPLMPSINKMSSVM